MPQHCITPASDEPALLSTLSALERAQRALCALGTPTRRTEHVPLDSAVGRVLARPLSADRRGALQFVGREAGSAEVVAPGTRLGVSHVPLLAAIGSTPVEVFARLRVGVLGLADAPTATAGSDASWPARQAVTTGRTLAAALRQLGAQAFEATCRLGAGEAADDVEFTRQLDMFRKECDLVVIVGFVPPRLARCFRGGAACAGTAAVSDVVLRPAGTLQVMRAGDVPAVALSAEPGLAFTAFVTLVAPLVRRLQGRHDVVPPSVAATLVPGDAAGSLAGMFLVREAIDPRLRQPVLHPCTDEALPVALAGATGLAWCPLDLPLRHRMSVAYLGFEAWLR